MPVPQTSNFDPKRGVSTSLLFPDPTDEQRGAPAIDGLPRPTRQDVPDLIANPERAHFFNTDCISCHTESTRRHILKLAAGDGMFRFKVPTGVSTVDPAHLPVDLWNVRNFGWFQRRDRTIMATVSMRTANEAAESVDFINREYLSSK